MKEYVVKKFFKSYWGWFTTPCDVADVAVANFLSYNSVDVHGFKRKQGITSIINVSEPLDVLWEKMRKKFIREQIERGKRRGITAGPNNDFATFERMYADFTHRLAFDSLPREALRNGILFLAYYEGEAIAGGVFITDGTHMRALALASKRVDEQSGRMRDIFGEANRLVIWEAIQYAKQHNYKMFDLGGIAPESKNAHWARVAVFKEAFGGERQSQYYYTKVYSPILKMWMKFREFLRR